MSKTDELGKRMKAYEGVATKKLVKKLPVIIRVDGMAFHTFTRKLNKPFDDLLMDAMEYTLQYLCKNVTGCVLGYMQSDEISLLVQDYKKEETQPWLGYCTEELCSITASMATNAFNRVFCNYTADFYDYCSTSEQLLEENKDRIHALLECCDKGAEFYTKAFSLPFTEVTNYFYWRQADAIRNSVEMVGHANFSPKQLYKVNTKGIIKKLKLEAGVDYDALSVPRKRGVCCIKTKMPSFTPDGHPTMKTTWVTDINIPVFKGDGREYIESKIGDTYY